MIREAIPLLTEETGDTTFDAEDIGELFEQFSESKLAELDERLDDSDWWAIEPRLTYIRENAEAFRTIG